MPKCWTRKAYQGGYYGNYSYYPYVFTASYSQPYNHGETSTSGHCMRFYRTSTSQTEAAVLPAIDAQYEIQDLQIRFWARLASYNTNKDLAIGVMTDPNDMNTFEAITPFVTVENDVYQEYTVTFENYQGEGRYIAIAYNTSSLYDIYVDDVTVELIPSCRIPTNLEANEITENQAVLTWTAGKDETAWNMQYKKTSDSEWSEIILVTETNYTLSNLKRGTMYEARVQANCTADDQSDWTEAISFTTECGVIPIAEEPFFENFENIGTSDFPPMCWDKFNYQMTSYSYWYLNSNNGLGSTAAYSSWYEGYAFLVLPKMHISGNATLSFDHLIGSGDYDESCSVVVSTNGGKTYNDFTETIWSGNETISGKASESVSLSAFDGQDIYIAFKFKGSGTSGCTWYVDNVQVYANTTQTVELYQGWNWFSANVEINMDNLKAALVATGNTSITIKSRTSNSIYTDSQWRGELTSLDVTQMYKIFVGTECEITLTGKPINPAEHPVTIYNGFNWIAFPLRESMSINEAFAGFAINGDIIKSITNNANYNDGQWRGLLNTLVPGQGYIYKSNATENKVFIFPTNAQ